MPHFLQKSFVVLLVALLAQPVLAAETPSSSKLPYAEIQSFVETFETIREGYVESMSDEDILRNALKGMASGLDPHSE